MTDFRDVIDAQRYEQGFVDADGTMRVVFADYARQGDTRVILHVEADPALRGTGAADRFMRALAAHAQDEGLKLSPRCGYAVTWLKRHREYAGLVV